MIRIICVGQKPPQWVVEASQVYVKRLKHTWPVEIIDVDHDRSQTANLRKEKESQRLLYVMSQCAGVHILLDIAGKSMNSECFAQSIQDIKDRGQSISFIIGGSDGVSDKIVQQSHQRLSLSQLTFPHSFARVMLLEQIYRSHCIQTNHPYHK